jgi:phospho-N-acetylmuramoyl-pentapeptide-transferase
MFQDPIVTTNIMRVFAVSAVAFVAAMAWTPILTRFLYKYKLGKQIREDANAPIYMSLHKNKAGTPTMGGLLVWATVFGLAGFFWLAGFLNIDSFISKLNFLSRSQTWLPIGALVISGLIGAIDDLMNIKKIGPKGGGMRVRHRLLFYSAVAIGGAWWFFYKLEWDLIHIAGVGDFYLGIWYIPLFIFIIIATAFSVNETDGLDGLAGGILLSCFAAFGAIAFFQGKVELAMFCAAISGALLAFLWFNIYPARFFMGDTGAMALGTTLGVVAMLTNSILVLPIVGFILVLESSSVIVQMASKKFRHKKIFLSTPIHHHFEAKGWPETKVTMRFWVISFVLATIGLVIGLIG